MIRYGEETVIAPNARAGTAAFHAKEARGAHACSSSNPAVADLQLKAPTGSADGSV